MQRAGLTMLVWFFFLCNSPGILEDTAARLGPCTEEWSLVIFWILCEDWSISCLACFRGVIVAAVKRAEVRCSGCVDVTHFVRPLDSLFPANAFRAVVRYRLNIWLGFYRHHWSVIFSWSVKFHKIPQFQPSQEVNLYSVVKLELHVAACIRLESKHSINCDAIRNCTGLNTSGRW